jgi:hypothetical protein
MARKKKFRADTSKVKKIVKQAAETYEAIEAHKEEVAKKDYERLIERIVDSVENKKKLDVLSYQSFVKQFPQARNTLNDLIAELRIFSVYDDEPHMVNFDYSAYLSQIKALVEVA